MNNSTERFVTDNQGNRVAVLIAMDRYTELLEAFEELADIRAYDQAKSSGDDAIPFEEAVREIESTSSGL
ncbi:MAG: hypothetical protein JJ896_10420 [Rhodothermales bacterium]|nr:hypothetical protein [Rhodothermales bacterium]MBO6780055.1 hypothetical protein [Rhodothermales bacterium]